MNLNINTKIIADTATPEIKRIMDEVQPAKLAQVARDPLESFTRRHLAANRPNKKGWPSTHFWEQAGRATHATALSNGVLIEINKIGVRQRWLGGAIAPVKAKALAIPISPVSYGKTPAEFPGLFLLATKKGAYLVQYGDGAFQGRKFSVRKLGGNAARRQRATLNFLFVLKKSVVQSPDPSVLPDVDEFASVIFTAILNRFGKN